MSWRERSQENKSALDSIHTEITPGQLRIDHRMAARILTECSLQDRRPIREDCVRTLAGMMADGKFMPESNALTFCELPNGRKILIDGYHVMSAAFRAASTGEYFVRVMECKDMDAVKREYAMYSKPLHKFTLVNKPDRKKENAMSSQTDHEFDEYFNKIISQNETSDPKIVEEQIDKPQSTHPSSSHNLYRRIGSQKIICTPDMAKEFLKHNTLETQRKLKPRWANELVEKMKRGLYRYGNIALAYTAWGTTHLMDGQHCCTAITKYGLGQECTVEIYHVNTKLGLSLLFKQFNQLPRTISEAVRVEKESLGLPWSNTVAALVASAASLLEEGGEKFNMPSVSFSKYNKLSMERKVEYISRYIPEGDFLERILRTDNKGEGWKMLKRAPVAAAMIMTWRKSASDAEIFWTRVRDGENLTRKMPEWKLREFYLSHSLFNYRNGKSYRKADNHEFIYKTITAWNAFREGREVYILKHLPNKPCPKIK